MRKKTKPAIYHKVDYRLQVIQGIYRINERVTEISVLKYL